MLKTVWENTNAVLFFESGEEECAKEFNLPFNEKSNPNSWLLEYLKKTCEGGNVNIIGQFEAGGYQHYELKNIKRSLFKVAR